MPKTIELSKTASVRHLALGPDNSMAAYLANLYIPIIDARNGTVIHRYEVPNQIAGLHFSEENANVLYACDDSFGMHVFDLRTKSRKKIRLNPDVENHTVTCTALSTSHLALASSTFGGGIADVRVSRKKEQHPHVVTLFDVRRLGEPLTTYQRSHKEEITCMSFYPNGINLMTGDKSGVVRSFNCDRRDEDNAIRWERWIKGPVTNVGLINRRIAYAIGDNSECNVFIDSKSGFEVLYGNAMESATDQGKNPSPVTYTNPDFVVGMVKGADHELPLVSVWGTQGQNMLHLTAIDQAGKRKTKNLANYTGHEGEVKCMAVNATNLVTGGADGKIVIKNVDFRGEGGGKAPKAEKSKKKDTSEKSKKSDKSEKTDKSQKSEKSQKSHKSDKTDKSEKANKPEKSEKSKKTQETDKTDKLEKSHKPEKTDKSLKSDKSHKFDRTDKSEKSHKSEKADKSAKADKSERSEKSKESHKSEKRDKSAKADSFDSTDKSEKSEKLKKSDKHEKTDKSEKSKKRDRENGSSSSSSSSHKSPSKPHKSKSSKDSDKPSSSRANPY